ncbi:MAG TPA: nicotinate-nucleotide--dimethylbenzimidazole phosphoribosyltransferase [Clostridiales bacterium UBA8960]|nr:nicotinate-nucleotide--dimethylbenzimidazole phosphoribosyltransferase [Clostridiales bacterium UBA8960]
MKIEKISGLNMAISEMTKNRIDNLVKPQGSMGELENIAIRLAGIYEQPMPTITKKAVIVMCADHGVCAEDVAVAPPIVTLIQSINIAKGVSGVGALAKSLGADVIAIDIGIDCDVTPEPLLDRKIRKGTENIAVRHAMTRDEAISAIQVGIDAVQHAKANGYNLIATGEMGIGNTTPSTAILSVLSSKSPTELTGIGANYPLEKLAHKPAVIEQAISSKTIDKHDPIDVLAAVGGLEIAGLTGVMLGGAINRVPVVIDGFISTIAALLACEMDPSVRNYLFPSHASEEKSASLASQMLGLKPYLHLGMRLGEGSGAVIAFSLLESACAMVKDMITFEEAGISVV